MPDVDPGADSGNRSNSGLGGTDQPAGPDDELSYRAEVVSDLCEVSADCWNRLAGSSNPFMRHEFLCALERHGCVGDRSGWSPRHVLLYQDQALVGAMPMYIKGHSYGEFVFDWAWADAYERSGERYYPKLVVAAPFTPATGPRLLVDRNHQGDVRALLASAAVQIADESKISSVHWLFAQREEIETMDNLGLLIRWGQQFHWHNPGFRDFQDYLDRMTSKRRKQIRRERRNAHAAPVEVEVLMGCDVQDHQWEAYHHLYASTYDRKWGYPSLTPGFFREVGQTLGDSVMLVLGRRDGRYIAGAHLFRSDDALFGRNWGCTEYHAALHFEMCYYRPIEYCIQHGLKRFEAGAGGRAQDQPRLSAGPHRVRSLDRRSAISRRHCGFPGARAPGDRALSGRDGCTLPVQGAARLA